MFDGAEIFDLVFPLSRECAGPDWLESGELIRTDAVETETEEIEAVSLGNSRFRLAERRLGSVTSLRLYWGDIFVADRLQGNTLNLTKVVVLRTYQYYRWLISDGFKNENPIAELVHEVHRGWEAVAIGMLTQTVPAMRAQEFQLKMKAAGSLPGLLTLED